MPTSGGELSLLDDWTENSEDIRINSTPRKVNSLVRVNSLVKSNLMMIEIFFLPITWFVEMRACQYFRNHIRGWLGAELL